jgi:hypothetical protein
MALSFYDYQLVREKKSNAKSDIFTIGSNL